VAKTHLKMSQKSKLITAWILVAIGVCGLVFSGFHYIHQQQVIQKIADVGAIDVGKIPSSTRPSAQAIASYTVAPDLPKYINIPAINVGNTRVIQLGTISNGQIAVPDNIFDTGWFDQSGKPGQAGAMFTAMSLAGKLRVSSTT
jgi:hypothetical protein